jgi:intracellular sulfur oxidation DsrE/DsrF family protein
VKRTLVMLALFSIVAIAGCSAVPPESMASKDVKMAFDFTDGNPKVLSAKLSNVDTTRKQLIDAGFTPHIVMTFRGDASYFTQTDAGLLKEADRADAAKVQAQLKALKAAPGVESLEQCTLPLAGRKISKDAVMSEVKVVPNGWIALTQYQQRGYGYIAP